MKRHPKLRDIAGLKFGKLTAISEAGLYKNRRVVWLCRCDCGVEATVRGDCLRSGTTKSCGCHRREIATTHGLSHKSEANCWSSMLQRCYNPNNQDFHNYGGRGIAVCERWRSDFAAFYADIGERPSPKHSLDRYPNKNGDYEPGNVRWATAAEQVRNRRVTKMIDVDGKNISLAEVAQNDGVKYGTAWDRLRRGESIGLRKRAGPTAIIP